MYMSIREWNKAENTDGIVAVWGDTAEYSPEIRTIVREIRENGQAVRGDSVYYEAEEE